MIGPVIVCPPRWRWTGDDLIRMTECGLLPPEGRFELMDGEILERMPPSPQHDLVVGLIADRLKEAVADEALHVRQEKTVRLDPHFDPIPDVSVVKGTLRDYADRFPGPNDVLLVIEVSDTTLAYDRSRKLTAYAAAGIGDYWIVNLQDGQVEVHRDPRGAEYLSRRVYKPDEAISPLALPAAAVPVASLLGT